MSPSRNCRNTYLHVCCARARATLTALLRTQPCWLKMFAWWLLVGAAMVALSSFVDFHTLSNQLDAMYMMRNCNIQYESVEADAMIRALTSHKKK